MVFKTRNVVLIAALAGGSVVCAQAGKPVTSHDGSCQVTVPADWSVTANFGIANSADKSMSLAVSSPRSSPTLAEVKQTAQSIYTDDKVVKDSASEFQMEGKSGNGKPNVYRGIQIPGKVCLVEVMYTNDATDEARKIAESLKAAK
jgi:hypothetical protein